MWNFLGGMAVEVFCYIFIGPPHWDISEDLSTGDSKRQSSNPVPAAIMFLLLGMTAGVLSLGLYRHRIITTDAWRIVALMMAPLASGWLFWRLCAPRKHSRAQKRNTTASSWYFTFGFLLAAPIAMIRFFCIK